MSSLFRSTNNLPFALVETTRLEDNLARKALEEQREKDKTRRHWYISVDLGQAQDPTALIIGSHAGPSQRHMTDIRIEALRRWPLGTAYPVIVEDLVKVCSNPQLWADGADIHLIVDWTGVGRGVVDWIRIAKFMQDSLFGAVPLVSKVKLAAFCITAGKEARHENGAWQYYVPKLDLVGCAQLALQNKKLSMPPPDLVPEVAVLVKEMLNFKYKITAANNLTAEAWREGMNDDLVLALSQLCWMVQRPPRSRNRWLGNRF